MDKIALVLAAMLAFSACSHDHSHSGEEAHEPHTLSYSLYTASAELFVEFLPLVAGDSVAFAAHLTRLGGYQPFREGELKVSLVSGAGTLTATAGVSATAGIFRPVIVPAEEGPCNLTFVWSGPGGSETFTIDSLTIYPSLSAAEQALGEPESSPTAIRFTKEQAWKTEFGIVQVQPAPFSEVIYTSGQILPTNSDETLIVAPFAGIVTFGGQVLAPGMQAVTGQRLMYLSGKGLAEDNIAVRYATLQSEYEKNKAQYERLEKLRADRSVTEQEFLEAKAAYEQAAAAFENMRTAYGGERKPVTASQAGFVKQVFVQEGAYVEAGAPLVSMGKNRRLIMRADVSQSHWHCLPDIREAHFRTPYNGTIYNTSDLNGKLISYSRNAANASWSAPVFFEIDNTQNLIPGSFAEVFLLGRPRPNVLSVPITALTEEQGNFFVFVQTEGESFEKREVKTGVSNGTEIEITYGLQPGERIVSIGSYQVKLASMSSSLPTHSHDH